MEFVRLIGRQLDGSEREPFLKIKTSLQASILLGRSPDRHAFTKESASASSSSEHSPEMSKSTAEGMRETEGAKESRKDKSVGGVLGGSQHSE